MAGCIAEDDLLSLVQGQRPLGDMSSLEAHLADCPACSALLATLLSNSSREQAGGWGNLAGRSLGPYRLDVQIGAGAAGEVYRAWDQRLNRHVAVKVLSPRVADSPEQIRRLEAEGRAAAAIAHPNVVTVHDVGSLDGMPFIVSELIEGESLRSLIDRGALPRARALQLGLQLVRGLAAAHARGVVHRDLKPENLLVTREGTLKILDFGLARLTETNPGQELDATQPGTVLGTAGYLSPEQARGEPADARSDLFSVGAILYELLSGQRAFGGATFAERLSSVLRDTPQRLDAEALGAALPVVARCLEKDASRRCQSAQDLAWVLEGLINASQAPEAPALPRSSRAGPARPLPRRSLLISMAASGIGGALLSQVLVPRQPPVSARVHPAYQQLTYRHGRLTSARFTRDGGSVVYAAAWDGQPLSVYTSRLGGGGTRPLALPSSDVLAISSRGQLALCLGRRYVAGFHTHGQLAIAPLEGGEPRILADAVQEADFTPDGHELAIIRRGGDGFRLELPLGNPLFETRGWLSHARLSPEGERVACLLHPSPMDDRGSLLVIERGTGAARAISDGWSSIAGLAWEPDGRGLWFTAAKRGSNSALRSVSLEGREAFIAETTGRLRLHDLSQAGLALVTHDTWRMRMMVRAPGASGEADLSLSDISLAGDLSADGSTLVFGEFGDIELESGSYLRPTHGGSALRLGAGHPASLSASGRHVLAVMGGTPSRVLIHSTSTGEQQELSLGPIHEVLGVRWSGDDQLVLVGAVRERPPRLWRVARKAGAPTPLTDEGLFGHCQVSPDGKHVAFIAADGRCLLLPVDAPGAVQVIPGSYRDEQVCGFRVGGSELFVRSLALPIRIRRVALSTGHSVPHAEILPPALGLKGVDSFVLSATGEAYAYSYGQELNRLYAMRRRVPA
ncbi:MAG: protein kinase [Myxococcaceae bacterium]|nr:protein kinase [Myxococcaceae bacterium]